jgi:hypothetical protein
MNDPQLHLWRRKCNRLRLYTLLPPTPVPPPPAKAKLDLENGCTYRLHPGLIRRGEYSQIIGASSFVTVPEIQPNQHILGPTRCLAQRGVTLDPLEQGSMG